MGYASWSIGYAVALFVGMAAFGELDRRMALRRAARDSESAAHRMGVINGAVFASLASSLRPRSGAVTRFDARRHAGTGPGRSIHGF